MAKSKSISELTNRIRSHQAKVAGATDPNACAAPAAKATDGDDPAKLGIPQNSKPFNADTGVASIDSLTVTKPSGAGENVPSPSMITSATSTPLDKAAQQAAALVQRMKSSMQKTNASAASATSAQRTKVADDVSLTADMLTKLGQAMLATDEGRQIAEAYLAKQAGVEAARLLIKSACDEQAVATLASQQHAELLKQASAEIQNETAELVAHLNQASAEEVQAIDKLAAAHLERIRCFNDPELVMFYKAGAMDAAQMQEGMAEGTPPEASLPGAESPLTLEQIAGLLDAMVQAGELEPVVAEEVLKALMNGEEGDQPESGESQEAPHEEEVKVAAAIRNQIARDLQ